MPKSKGRDPEPSPARESPAAHWPHVTFAAIDRTHPSARLILILDGLSWVLAAAGLILMLSARAHYSNWLFLGLALPALRLVSFGSFRQRVMKAFRDQAGAVQAFAAGSGPVPWKGAALFVVVPVFLFVVSNGTLLGSIDTRPVIPTAVSLVREGNWDVSEFARGGTNSLIRDQSGEIPLSFQVRGDRIYSAFPSGMVLFAAPMAGLSRLSGANLDDRVVHLRLEKITAAFVAALCLGFFFLTASCLGSAQAAGTATVLLAISSSLYTTVGLGLWQHGGVVFWLLIALLVEFASDGAPTRKGSAIQGIACSGLLTCRPTAALLVAGLGIWIFLRSPRRALLTMVVATVAFLPCVAVYESLYGTVLGPLTIQLNMTGARWHFGRIDTLAGVFVCPGRGLFVYQPWAVLSLLALIPAVRRLTSEKRLRVAPLGWMAYCLIISAVHCVVVSSWFDWSGGYCWGSRLLTDIIPLLGLLCVPVLEWLGKRPQTRNIIVAVAVLGALTHFPCVYRNAASWNYVTDHEGDLWSWSNAPFLYEGPR
jgi:hypothetical protein